MKKTINTILFLLGTFVYSQGVQISTYKFKAHERFEVAKTEYLKFPIINSGKKKIDLLINKDLKNRFTRNEYLNATTDIALRKFSSENIFFLNYEVAYNDNQLLSLKISAGSFGNYFYYWSEYYNYSIITGKLLILTDVVKITEEFKRKINNDRINQYSQHKEELKEMLNDANSGLENSTYQWALEYYESCEEHFNPETFLIYPNYLKIIDHCSLPNAIKTYDPIIKLEYYFKDIKELLKITI